MEVYRNTNNVRLVLEIVVLFEGNMKKIILEEALIGFDIDGVFRNFTKAHNIAYNSNISRDIRIDENFEPPIYHFSDNEIYDKVVLEKVWKDEQTYMFEHADIYDGAKDLFDFLQMIDCKHSFFITHQFTDEAKVATLKWLVKHGLTHSCIFCDGDDKYKYCDVLLDDKIENLEAMDARGKYAFCLARPWNTEYKGRRGDHSDFRKFLLEIGV